jgi:hypothetical protein
MPYGSGYPAPYPAYPGAAGYPGYPLPHDIQDPDNTLGIVGLVLSIVGCSPVGLVISWMALNKSKQHGYKNTLALVGTIIGGVFTAITVFAFLFYLFVFLLAFSTV